MDPKKHFKRISEVPPEILAYSRVKHKKWNKGKKANVVVCSNFNYGFSKPVKCKECGGICYYTENESSDLKKKKIKTICSECVLTKNKYRKHLNEEQIKLLEMAKENNEEIIKIMLASEEVLKKDWSNELDERWNDS